MAWSKQEKKIFYFQIPPRTYGLLNDNHYESYCFRDGWVFENGENTFMIPQQYQDIYNSELWVGVKNGKKQLVHCLNTGRPRTIQPDNTNPLTKVYEMCNDGTPAFYIIDEFEFLEMIEEKPVKKSIPKTFLMKTEEIINYCNEWINALPTFPNDDFSDIGLSVTKHQLEEHFINSREKIIAGSKALPQILKEYELEQVTFS